MYALFIREVGGSWSLLTTGNEKELKDNLAAQMGETFGTETKRNAGGVEIRKDGYMTGCVVRFELEHNPWFAQFMDVEAVA